MPTLITPGNATPSVFVIGGSGGFRIPPGTVKKTGTPDTPGRYLVNLHKQKNGRLIDQVWSDPVTGAYAFSYVAPDKYYVVAFDHTGEYGGVIETDLVAEPMP